MFKVNLDAALDNDNNLKRVGALLHNLEGQIDYNFFAYGRDFLCIYKENSC